MIEFTNVKKVECEPIDSDNINKMNYMCEISFLRKHPKIVSVERISNNGQSNSTISWEGVTNDNRNAHYVTTFYPSKFKCVIEDDNLKCE